MTEIRRDSSALRRSFRLNLKRGATVAIFATEEPLGPPWHLTKADGGMIAINKECNYRRNSAILAEQSQNT